MTTPLVSISHLTKAYGAIAVLHDISLSLEKGRCLSLIGPSGSGKTTLLRCINYLEVPDSGEIRLDGALIGQRQTGNRTVRLGARQLAPQRLEVGFVFQSFNLWPHLTVLENVSLAPHRVRGLSKPEATAIAEKALAKVHILHKAHEYPERLSGGQQQRVGIARALAQQPRVILFDEPTSALDPELVGEVLEVIRELADEGLSMILVTHEIKFARDVAHEVVFMDGGNIVEQGPPAEVIGNPQMPRTQKFLAKFHAA